MSDIDSTQSGDRPDDDRLRWALRNLRRDTLPEHDLWPRIAARIAEPPALPSRRRATRLVPWALAASLLLGLALAWQLGGLQDGPAESGEARLIAHEAQAMTREYHGALRELSASTPAAVQQAPALRELDRSAEQIRSALAKDPGARFLLDRLHHTYSLRLALTQRAAALT
jgi:hypothetical protein